MGRRLLLLLAVLLPAVSCGSAREDARDEFVDQLVDEGGLPRDVAECVADGFFEDRSTDEMRKFFEREELTAQEQAEFARLGEQCLAAVGVPTTGG